MGQSPFAAWACVTVLLLGVAAAGCEEAGQHPPQEARDARVVRRPGRVERLTQSLGSSSPSVRARAAQQLAELDAKAQPALPTLTRLASSDKELEVRVAAAIALHRIAPQTPRSRKALSTLLASTRDENALRQLTAYLGTQGTRAGFAIPLLVQMIGDPARKGYAALALGEIGSPAVPALREALRGDNLIARRGAAYAFHTMGARGAAAKAQLKMARNDPDPIVRRHVRGALRRIERQGTPGPGPP